MQLILLVGSNPLPNYLTACALRPSHIVLVYTSETKKTKNSLRRELAQSLGNHVTFDEAFVEDATCATTIRRDLEPFLQNKDGGELHLNYTGGTKVMAAHARMAFSGSGGKPECASYLDEGGKDRQPRLRFDDGNSNALSECNASLTLRTVLALHGITHKQRDSRKPEPTSDDAREILHKVLADVSLAATLYCESRRLKELRNPNKATSEPFRADRHGLSLSLPKWPTNEQLGQLGSRKEKESWFKQWYAFIGGEWLEEWVGDQIHAMDPPSEPEITIGVNAYRGDKRAQLEVDLAVIRGHRSYFISCTTNTGKPVCKSKLFEIAVRSRQLGGDLARAALVCLADDETVRALQADVDDVWGASNTTKVFGLSDIRAWSDCDGKQPNRQSLKAWLES